MWNNILQTVGLGPQNNNSLTAAGQGPSTTNALMNTVSNIGGPSDDELGALADAEMGGAVKADLGVGSAALEAVSPTSSRFGNVLASLGPTLAQGSQQRGPVAPPFKPNFQRPQQQAFGSDVSAQIGSMDYNI